MTKRMLIDANDPAEVRVVVLNRSRVEEFDHEIRSKAQLKGNIYLAKVTRVEPSLQAAFVDYGGNRHGFLPFSEIHPDYYRIPIADREALLAEEAALKSTPYDDEIDDIEDHVEGADPMFVEEPEPVLDEAGLADVIIEDGGALRAAGDDEAPREAAFEASLQEPESEAESRDADQADEPDHGEDDEGQDDNGEGAPADTDEDDPEPRGGRGMAHVVEGGEQRSTLPGDSVDEPEAASHDSEEAGEDEAVDAQDQDGHEDSEEAEGDEAPLAAAEGGEEAGDDSGEDEGGGRQRDGRGQRSRRGRRERGHRVASTTEAETDSAVDTVGGDDIEDAARRRAKLLRRYKIQEVIKRGQVMLVQVAKEERGNKGAALTTYLSLPGRYCVLMPNTARGGGISRKIGSATDRKRLKTVLGDLAIPDGMAVIVRTAGSERSKAEIKRDYEYLIRLWSEIREATLSSQAPALIYEEGNLIKRAIRDLYTSDTEEILVEGEDAYKAAKAFMRSLMPSHAKKVQLYKEAAVPLFLKHQVESQLGAMFETTVQLKSGGYIVINVTEALVAIDVNSGKATRERHIEETALKTNLEAADEVARQLRLRDLAGLIVIDFIDMEENRHNRDVERRLKEAMKSDRARIQLGRISPFGLLELSRQRLRPSLVETATVLCPHCQGTGRIYSAETAALHLLRALAEEGMRRPGGELTVTVGTKVALFLLNQKRDQLGEIETRFEYTLTLEVDDRLHGLDHRIERQGPRDSGRGERERPRGRDARRPDRGERPDRSERQERSEDRSEDGDESRAPRESRESRESRGGRGDRQRGKDSRGRDDHRRRREEPRAVAPVEELEDPEEAADAAAAAAEASETSAPQEANGPAADDDSRGRRRRRRGKRGGRRRGRRQDEQGEQSDEIAAAGDGGQSADEDASDEDGDGQAFEAADDERRWSQDEDEEGGSQVAQDDGGDERPGDDADDAQEPPETAALADSASDEEAAPAADERLSDEQFSDGQPSDERSSDGQPSDERPANGGLDAVTEADPSEPKRRGWWNRLVR